jgi:hypothetical protein
MKFVPRNSGDRSAADPDPSGPAVPEFSLLGLGEGLHALAKSQQSRDQDHLAKVHFILQDLGLEASDLGAITTGVGMFAHISKLSIALHKNRAGDLGAEVLGELLQQLGTRSAPKDPKLESLQLHLADNELTPEGPSKLFEGLARLHKLSDLDLDFSGNPIIGDGANGSVNGRTNICKFLVNRGESGAELEKTPQTGDRVIPQPVSAQATRYGQCGPMSALLLNFGPIDPIEERQLRVELGGLSDITELKRELTSFS